MRGALQGACRRERHCHDARAHFRDAHAWGENEGSVGAQPIAAETRCVLHLVPRGAHVWHAFSHRRGVLRPRRAYRQSVCGTARKPCRHLPACPWCGRAGPWQCPTANEGHGRAGQPVDPTQTHRRINPRAFVCREMEAPSETCRRIRSGRSRQTGWQALQGRPAGAQSRKP